MDRPAAMKTEHAKNGWHSAADDDSTRLARKAGVYDIRACVKHSPSFCVSLLMQCNTDVGRNYAWRWNASKHVRYKSYKLKRIGQSECVCDRNTDIGIHKYNMTQEHVPPNNGLASCPQCIAASVLSSNCNWQKAQEIAVGGSCLFRGSKHAHSYKKDEMNFEFWYRYWCMWMCTEGCWTCSLWHHTDIRVQRHYQP